LRDALKTHDFDDLKLLAGMDEAFTKLRDFDASESVSVDAT
jgi:hypothetical protein